MIGQILLIGEKIINLKVEGGFEMICKFCGSGDVSMFFEEVQEKLGPNSVRITKECDWCGEKWV